MARPKKIQGMGDVVKTITDFVGIVPCQACLERQAKWNLQFPTKLSPRELTEQELNEWKQFQDEKPTLELSNKQRLFLCKIYSYVFQVPYYEPCINCSPKPYIVMIERMDFIYGTYEN